MYILKNKHVAGTSYSLDLPVGSYRADIQAVNTKYADLKSNWNTSGYFDVEPYRTITLTANPAEGGTVKGGSTYFLQGDSATLRATPNESWRFKGWVRNGQPVTDWVDTGSTTAEYRLTVTGDETFEALFERITPPVSMEVTMQDGTISATILPQGETVGSVIAAAYSPDGAMIGVQTLAYANRTTGDKYEYLFYNLPLDDAYYVKVFALDASRTPICPSKMIFTGVVQGTIPEPD